MKGRSTLPEGRVKMINREDMLELTRRMTPERACFTRLAGAYITEEGEIEDTFNINFLNHFKPVVRILVIVEILNLMGKFS